MSIRNLSGNVSVLHLDVERLLKCHMQDSFIRQIQKPTVDVSEKVFQRCTKKNTTHTGMQNLGVTIQITPVILHTEQKGFE